jgi:hypothetical protein
MKTDTYVGPQVEGVSVRVSNKRQTQYNYLTGKAIPVMAGRYSRGWTE